MAGLLGLYGGMGVRRLGDRHWQITKVTISNGKWFHSIGPRMVSHGATGPCTTRAEAPTMDRSESGLTIFQSDLNRLMLEQ